MATAPVSTDYPKWLYHAELGSILVNSPVEEKELGDGWEIHPDKAKAEHIKKVNEMRAKAEEEKKKLDEKFQQDKAKAEQDLAKQLDENALSQTVPGRAKLAAQKNAATVQKNTFEKADSERAANDARVKADETRRLKEDEANRAAPENPDPLKKAV